MSYNLVLNSNNAVNNSTFKYQFINGSFTIHDEAEICISNIQIPYSWFNITANYDNQFFQMIFPTSTGLQTYSITITPGFYSVTDMNAFLQQYCITNGLYLINASGQYVYYLTFLYNITYYGVQLVTNVVPTSLPAGWTAPGNWVGFYSSSVSPQLIVTTNNFGKFIGFLPGTYPTVNTANASILNTFTPLGSNVNSLIIRCSLVDNQIGVPTDILDTMPVNATFGSNINYQPPSLKWIKLTPCTHQYLTITFVDQNLNTLYAQDPNVTISILLNNKGKEVKKVVPKLNIKIDS